MLRWTQLLLERGLLKGPASVVGLSSEGSSRYLPDYAAVAAAKAVMISNMQYMAVELAGTGIRVNLVNAGITDTDALKAFPSYHEFLEKAKKRNPSGRLTTPEDIAPVITFLASPASAWVNGSVITADGGEQLMSLN
jgi:enoyl-[acyl-carrier protein] reductase I